MPGANVMKYVTFRAVMAKVYAITKTENYFFGLDLQFYNSER